MNNEQNTTALTRITDPADSAIIALDEAAKKASLIKANIEAPFATAVRMANAVAVIKTRLTDAVMAPVMELMNTPIGFRTDRPNAKYPSPYGIGVVKDALIEATLRGIPPVGNCWNIIGGRMYITKEGFKFLLDRIAGLKWSITPSAIICDKENPKQVEVHMNCKWRMNGGAEEFERVSFIVRVNAEMGSDALFGKGMRKAEAWLYTKLTGIDAPEGSAEEPPIQIISPEKPVQKSQSGILAGALGLDKEGV